MKKILLSLFINLMFIFNAYGWSELPRMLSSRLSENDLPIRIAIVRYDPAVGEEGSKNIVRRAILMWQEPSCTKLRMDLVSKESGNIHISFAFSGAKVGAGVANSGMPCRITTARYILAVAHEIGHCLGLNHTPVRPSIMKSGYNPGEPEELSKDDIEGICSIWPCPSLMIVNASLIKCV
jgi:hypothetical protein